MASKLLQRIERETGGNYGIHRATAFPDFHITKTSVQPPHELTYISSYTPSIRDNNSDKRSTEEQFTSPMESFPERPSRRQRRNMRQRRILQEVG